MSVIQTRVWKGIQFNTSEYLKLASSATDQEVRSFITGEEAVLNFDEQAFVVDYPGLWKKVFPV